MVHFMMITRKWFVAWTDQVVVFFQQVRLGRLVMTLPRDIRKKTLESIKVRVI